jgi:hypothetical protein
MTSASTDWRCDRSKLAHGVSPLAVDAGKLALQLPFLQISESMGNHDSKIVDADSVD